MPAVPENSGILSKFTMKSKMADASSKILYDSVRFILSNWTVLQLAVEHGFGGRDSREKAEWMVNVVNQVLQENDTIENDELADYIEEILFNEFDTMAEDGSLPKVVQKLCSYHRLWKQGNTAQIQQEISSAPITKLPQCIKKKEVASQSDSDSDGDDEDSRGKERGAQALYNGYHEDNGSSSSTVSQQLGELHLSENGTQGPSSAPTGTRESQSPSDLSLKQSQMQPDQDEEGWEVVRRSKRR